MDLATVLETWGEPTVLALGGAAVGVLFGFSAQRSRFCLRAAVIEFWHRRFGDKLAVWLLAFSTAVVVVQALILLHQLDVSTARQLSNRGSLSGALIGGLLFGCGMVMTRGCASRLLVLSANGNLRALLSGLVFAAAAQASLGGVLVAPRMWLSNLWMVDGGPSRDLLAQLGLNHWGGLLAGLVWMAAAVFFALRTANRFWMWVGGVGTGLAVAAAWWFSALVAHTSFNVVPIQGLTFSGPSAEWLMRVLSAPGAAVGFDFGMLPGVFLGSLIGAIVGRDLKIEGFKDGYSMARYIVGAVAMGFGAIMAGGCAVGAGMSGGAIFALTAWLTLIGMWAGAGLMDRLLDHQPEAQPGPALGERALPILP